VNATSWVSLVLLVLAAVLIVWRAVRPSSLGDRAVAFDALASVIQCGLFVGAVLMGDGILVELALVLGLLGFLSSVTVGRFLERRGDQVGAPGTDRA
jgi:multicomponent Na+:H+ antiporter subunit F